MGLDSEEIKTDKVDAPMFEGQTPPEEDLYYYVGEYANLEKVKEIVDSGVKIHDEYYENILHEACAYGNTKIVNYLISLGLDVNSQIESLDTPLHSACWNTQTLAARELIHKGADVNILNSDGISPLYAAALQGGVHTAHLLIENGAQEDIYIAAMIGDFDFIKQAYNKNFDIINTVNDRDNDGASLLHWVAQRNYINIVDFLIRKGIDPNIQDASGDTPLNSAAFFDKNFEAAKILIDSGCIIDTPNDVGDTPLYRATGAVEMTKLLCERGHKTNVVNNKGNTPLHEAVRKCNLDVVRILLRFKASKKIKNKEGLTPKMFAKKYRPTKDNKKKLKEIVSLL